VSNETNVGFVDTHPKSIRGYDHLFLAGHEVFLRSYSLNVGQAGVVHRHAQVGLK
jgi:hypothetical protein